MRGVLIAAACAALLGAAPADAAVTVVRTDATAITVKVTGKHRVRLAARPAGIVRARTVRGPRTLRLALTARGRKLAAGCPVTRVRLGGRTVRLGRACPVPTGTPAPAGSPAAFPTAGATPTPTPTAGATPTPTPAPTTAPTLPDITTGFDLPGCDPIDPSVCLLPFPNDLFTKADPSTPTGRRLDLHLTAMPRNVLGLPIDPSEYNRADGFSPGTPIVVKVAGLENQAAFDKAGLVPQTDLARAYDPAQPVVLIDADTLERQLVWAELDATADTDAHRTLVIRPARNLAEGHRFIVALRNLDVPDDPTFALYRDGRLSLNPLIEGRRAHMESLFATLARAGVTRKSLHLAWDFTVASRRDRTERARWMRDQAFAELGDTTMGDLTVQGRSPQFTVTSSAPDADDPRIARIVDGTVTVPCFLDQQGCPPGSRFRYAKATDLLPQRTAGNTTQAKFRCIVPQVAVDTGDARISLYGHGLFGSRSEVHQGQLRDMAVEHDMVFCATDWIGMSTDGGIAGQQTYGDIPFIATALLDLSNFPVLADRVQQGLLNFMVLGRTMIHPQGFAANPAFQDASGHSILDTRRLYYDGNSQGGIIGGALMALEPDAQRGVLGVPGMNYSTLLNRSTDFEVDPDHACPPTDPTDLDPALIDPSNPESFLEFLHFSYACPLYAAYPDHTQRQLVFALLQQLWDRAEADGYALHMTTDPLPGTPAHTVLMHPALGDHQVSNVAAEVEARTIGARVRPTPVDPGRSFDVTPFYGIPRIASYPYGGSAIEPWDSGRTPPAPVGNRTPREGEDPHEEPRNTVAARAQKSAFLRPDGKVVDTCAGGPCHSRLK